MEIEMNRGSHLASAAITSLGASLLTIFILTHLDTPRVVDVHQDGNYSDILVSGFPWTDQGKIDWWLRHRENLHRTRHIPAPDHDGGYYVMIWSFGAGYKKEDDQDRFCFNDMKTDFKCIEKNSLMFINHSANRGLILEIGSHNYRIGADQSVTRLRDS